MSASCIRTDLTPATWRRTAACFGRSVISNMKFTLRHSYQSYPTWSSHYGTAISHIQREVHTTAQLSVMSNVKFTLRHSYQSCPTWSSHYGAAISHVQREVHTTAQLSVFLFFAEFIPFWHTLLSTNKRLPSSTTKFINLILQRTSSCVYEQTKSI